MKTLQLEYKQLTREEKRGWLGKFGSVDQMEHYLDLAKEDVDAGILVVDATTGRKLLYIGAMRGYDTQAVFDYLGSLRISPKSRLSRGVVSNHIQIGFTPRNNFRGNFCTPTLSMMEHKDLQVFGHYMALHGEAEYKKAMPEMYADHVKEMEKLKDDQLKISPTSLFTSAVINKSNRIQYHLDKGNTSEGATLMCYVMRDTKGGELLLPELGLAINVTDGVFILAEGHKLIHGVAPIERTTESAERYSVVYYSKKELFNCKVVLDDEQDYANEKNTINFVEKLDNMESLQKMRDRNYNKVKEKYGFNEEQD